MLPHRYLLAAVFDLRVLSRARRQNEDTSVILDRVVHKIARTLEFSKKETQRSRDLKPDVGEGFYFPVRQLLVSAVGGKVTELCLDQLLL